MRPPPKSVCAVIPTRGDVPDAIKEITEHLYGYPEVAVVKVMVGNSTFNRYLGARDAEQEIIFTQDDDCITDIGPVLEAYNPRLLVNAMTRRHEKNYPRRQTLVGFGSIFHRKLLAAVFDKKWVHDALFMSKSDRIFATVNEHRSVFPEIRILPCADDPCRLGRQPDHTAKVQAMNKRIFELAGIRA